jgi:hypothetical protein
MSTTVTMSTTLRRSSAPRRSCGVPLRLSAIDAALHALLLVDGPSASAHRPGRDARSVAAGRSLLDRPPSGAARRAATATPSPALPRVVTVASLKSCLSSSSIAPCAAVPRSGGRKRKVSFFWDVVVHPQDHDREGAAPVAAAWEARGAEDDLDVSYHRGTAGGGGDDLDVSCHRGPVATTVGARETRGDDDDLDVSYHRGRAAGRR